MSEDQSQNQTIDQNPQPVNTQQTVQQPEQMPDIKTEENKKNWAEFRAAREAERKAKIEAEQRVMEKTREAEALKAALEAALSKKSPQYYDQKREDSIYYNPSEEETEEQKIEKKVNQILQKRDEDYRKQRAIEEAQEMPKTLRKIHTDFDRVCTTENIDYLEYHYPEVANAYKMTPDSVEKWSNVYQAIKRFVPNIDGGKEMAKAQQNLQKPQSLSKPGAATAGHSMPDYILTEERKKANYERMQKIMNTIE